MRTRRVRETAFTVAAVGLLLAACGGRSAHGPVGPDSSAGRTGGTGRTGELRWRTVGDLPVTDSAFTGISAAGAGAVFAVGSREEEPRRPLEMGKVRPVATRWDGHRWSSMTKGLPRTGIALDQIAAASASDVWAIGSQDPCCQSWLYRWNGTSWKRWQGLEDATPDSEKIVAVPGEAWVTYAKRNDDIVLRHWDGRQWYGRPLSPGYPGTYVSAIQPVPGDRAIVTVTSSGGPGPESARRGTVTHALLWQNGAWSALPLPADVGAVTMISATDMWAAGTTCVGPYARQAREDIWTQECKGGRRHWLRRWDGTAWRQAALPGDIPTDATFTQFVGQSRDNLLLTARGPGGEQTLLRYDGSRWRRATGDQAPYGMCSEISGISPVPGTTAFVAAGGGPAESRGCVALAGRLGPG